MLLVDKKTTRQFIGYTSPGSFVCLQTQLNASWLHDIAGCWKHSSQILMHHTVPAAFFQLHLLREFSVPPHLKGAQLDSHVAAVEAI